LIDVDLRKETIYIEDISQTTLAVDVQLVKVPHQNNTLIEVFGNACNNAIKAKLIRSVNGLDIPTYSAILNKIL
jgi:hypothetical protein